MQFSDREKFIVHMTAEQPIRPANIANIVAINQGKRPLTQENPRVPPFTPQSAYELLQGDTILVDTRSQAAFGAAHIPKAFNIQLTAAEFEQRVGWVTPPDAPIMLLGETADEAQHAAYLMAFIGLDQRVRGYVRGGMDAWLDAGLPHVTLGQISVHQLHRRLQENGMQMLDVRETSEWDSGHIANAAYMNYKTLPRQMGALDWAPETAVAIICASGRRSSTAGSLLLRHGFKSIYNVTGGMNAWNAAKLPVIGGR